MAPASATNDYRVHAQQALREQRADNERGEGDNDARAQQGKPMRCYGRHGGWSTGQADGGDKSTQSEIDHGLLRCRRESAHGRSPRAQPTAHEPSHQRASSPTQRQRNAAEAEISQTEQQTYGEPAGKKGDVRSMAAAQRLPDPWQHTV